MKAVLLLVFLCGVFSQTNTLVSRETGDNNSNGHIDRIVLTFQNDVDTAQANAAVKAGAFKVTGYVVNNTLGYSSLTTKTGYVIVNEIASPDTGAAPATRYTSIGGSAITGLGSDASDVNAADKAAPVLLAAFACDTFDNTYFTVQFSEPVQGSATAASPLVPANFDLSNLACSGFMVSNGGFNAFTTMYEDNGDDKFVSITTNGNMFSSGTGGNLGCTTISTVTTGSVLQDTAGNPTAGGSVTLQGSVDPAAFTFAYVDQNSNGKIDAIRVTSVQPLRDEFFVADWAPSGGLTIGGRTLTGSNTGFGGDISVHANDQFYYLGFAEVAGANVFDTGSALTFSFTPNPANCYAEDWRGEAIYANCNGGSFNSAGRLDSTDLTGNNNVADGAGPVLVAAQTNDSDSNGFIDQIILTFSEPVMDVSTSLADWTVATYTVTGLSTGATANDNTLVIRVAEKVDRDGAARPNVTYVAPVALLADLSPAKNTILAGSGMQAADGVAPRILSATSVSLSTVLTITFSEPVFSNANGAGVLSDVNFEFVNGNMGGATGISGMTDGVGSDGSVAATVNNPFQQGDFGMDTVAADNLFPIYDASGNICPSTPVVITGPGSSASAVGASFVIFVVCLLFHF